MNVAPLVPLCVLLPVPLTQGEPSRLSHRAPYGHSHSSWKQHGPAPAPTSSITFLGKEEMLVARPLGPHLTGGRPLLRAKTHPLSSVAWKMRIGPAFFSVAYLLRS